jgi:hypothetical protein
MSKRIQDLVAVLGIYGSLVALAVFGVFVAFQWHATLVYAGIRAVESATVNRLGWNTSTILGLSRFLYLVIGGIWLACVAFLEYYLREAERRHVLGNRVLRAALIGAALYGLSYLLLQIL